MTNRHAAGELLAQLLGFLKETAQLLILDAILTVHLFDEQFAVAVNEQRVLRAKLQRMFQSAHESGVFRLVVRHLAEAAGLLDGRFAVTSNDISERRGAGVAARSAVG